MKSGLKKNSLTNTGPIKESKRGTNQTDQKRAQRSAAQAESAAKVPSDFAAQKGDASDGSEQCDL